MSIGLEYVHVLHSFLTYAHLYSHKISINFPNSCTLLTNLITIRVQQLNANYIIEFILTRFKQKLHKQIMEVHKIK